MEIWIVSPWRAAMLVKQTSSGLAHRDLWSLPLLWGLAAIPAPVYIKEKTVIFAPSVLNWGKWPLCLLLLFSFSFTFLGCIFPAFLPPVLGLLSLLLPHLKHQWDALSHHSATTSPDRVQPGPRSPLSHSTPPGAVPPYLIISLLKLIPLPPPISSSPRWESAPSCLV